MLEPGTLVVWGASGHAKVVADVARSTGWTIAGFLDDVTPARAGQAFAGAMVLGSLESLLASGWPGGAGVALGVGDNRSRLECARTLLARGLALPALVHTAAHVGPGVLLGDGAVIAAGAVLNPDVRVGTAALVNTRASVDHDCTVGDGAHVAPGATLCGSVRVGDGVLVGAGAVVLPRRRLGDWSLVGAGSTVTRDVPAEGRVTGTPARPHG